MNYEITEGDITAAVEAFKQSVNRGGMDLMLKFRPFTGTLTANPTVSGNLEEAYKEITSLASEDKEAAFENLKGIFAFGFVLGSLSAELKQNTEAEESTVEVG